MDLQFLIFCWFMSLVCVYYIGYKRAMDYCTRHLEELDK